MNHAGHGPDTIASVAWSRFAKGQMAWCCPAPDPLRRVPSFVGAMALCGSLSPSITLDCLRVALPDAVPAALLPMVQDTRTGTTAVPGPMPLATSLL